jgi:ribosomal protein L17
MKYTCLTCDYSTNDKSNFNRHLKRKRKCVPKTTRKRLENDQKVPENDQDRLTIGSQKPQQGSQRLTKTATRLTKGSQKPQQGSKRLTKTATRDTDDLQKVQQDYVNIQQECVHVQKDTQEHMNSVQSPLKKMWECPHCFKQFKHNRNWNRHMRLYCKGKNIKTQILEQENAALRKIISEGGIRTTHDNRTTNNTINNNTTNNNITNNIVNNFTLPEGQWTRMLQRMMVLLMTKTRGDRFQEGQLHFTDAFQETMSLAFFHPDSPIYETVKLLGRKDSWAKHNGNLIGKTKLIKKINRQHYERLLLFMKADNERFRKELPPAPVIEKWIEVNNEVISHIHKYDPCEKQIIKNTEEVLLNRKLPSNYTKLISEVKESDRMDRMIAKSQMP